MSGPCEVEVRPTRPEDFPGIEALCRQVYPTSLPWTEQMLASHLNVFPEGQIVAVQRDNGTVVGMAASLVLLWDDYETHETWREFTDEGRFTNHNPSGRTLYGAEVMVDPTLQRCGIGKKIYAARRGIVERLGLLRIRAGARLRGYHRYAQTMSPEEYVEGVVRGEIEGPTLSFQLREGFAVIAVVPNYLRSDPESLGNAAVIEWLNPALATPEHYAAHDPRYAVVRSPT